MGRFLNETAEVEKTGVVFILALEQSAKDAVLAETRDTHGFQTTSAVDTTLIAEQQMHAQ